MEIWLQRVTIPFLKDQTFDEPICKLVAGESVSIWNNEWIASNDLKTIINADRIVDREIIEKLDLIIPAIEIELFSSKAKGYGYE